MSSNATCPYCQAPLNVTDTIGGQPTVCPHCLTNILNPQMTPAGEAPNVLRDIRRKVRGLSWFFWLIIGLGIGVCVSGIVVYKINSKPAHQRLLPIDLWPWFIGLAVFVILAILVPLWRYLRVSLFSGHDDPMGRIIALAILTLVLTVAILAFFEAVCTAIR